eukprot:3441955-Amphidinium_carterae.1
MGAACSLYLRPIRGRPPSGQMARTHECDCHAASTVALHNGVCALISPRGVPSVCKPWSRAQHYRPSWSTISAVTRLL